MTSVRQAYAMLRTAILLVVVAACHAPSPLLADERHGKIPGEGRLALSEQDVTLIVSQTVAKFFRGHYLTNWDSPMPVAILGDVEQLPDSIVAMPVVTGDQATQIPRFVFTFDATDGGGLEVGAAHVMSETYTWVFALKAAEVSPGEWSLEVQRGFAVR